MGKNYESQCTTQASELSHPGVRGLGHVCTTLSAYKYTIYIITLSLIGSALHEQWLIP